MAEEVSLATLQYITREQLADILLQHHNSSISSEPIPSSLAIVDMRDSDYIGGHIKGCINIPSTSLDYAMQDLIRRLKDKKTVVFHCLMSQERGPRAALRYIRATQTMNAKTAAGAAGDAEKDGASLESPAEQKQKQQVYVLGGGFGYWQAKYGDNKALTEAYEKDIWME